MQKCEVPDGSEAQSWLPMYCVPGTFLQGLKQHKSSFLFESCYFREDGVGDPLLLPCVMMVLKHGIRVHWAPWEAVKACQHVLPSLQEKAEEVYRVYQNSPLSSHPVVALSELSTLCAGCCPDERTFYLVLLQLQKEKRVTVLEQNGEKVWRVIRSVIDSLMAY